MALLSALAGALLLFGCSHENDAATPHRPAGSASAAPPGVEKIADPEPVDLTLDCTGNQISAGTFDYVPPATRAEALRQDWPRSPEESLGGMADPDSRRGQRLGIVSLSDGVRSATHGRVTVRFAGLDAEGATVAVFVADRIFRDVWAVGQMQECA